LERETRRRYAVTQSNAFTLTQIKKELDKKNRVSYKRHLRYPKADLWLTMYSWISFNVPDVCNHIYFGIGLERQFDGAGK
jgi:hypothetical protein